MKLKKLFWTLAVPVFVVGTSATLIACSGGDDTTTDANTVNLNPGNKEFSYTTLASDLASENTNEVIKAEDGNSLTYIDKVTNLKFIFYKNSRTGDFYFSEEQIPVFVETALKSIDYGPEIIALKTVIFDYSNTIVPSASGLYVPQLGQIFVNTNNVANNSNLTYQRRVNYVLPTLKHEYIHHLASVYIDKDAQSNTISANSAVETQDRTSGTAASKYFNKTFYDAFTKILNYVNNDTNNSYYDGSVSSGQCLCNYFSASQLFTISNSSDPSELVSKFNSILSAQPAGMQSLSFDTFTSGRTVENASTEAYSATSEARLTNANIWSPSYSSIQGVNYTYSMTELIAREWTKLAQTSAYSDTNVGNLYQNWFTTQGMTASNVPGTLVNANAEDWSRTIQLKNNLVTTDGVNERGYQLVLDNTNGTLLNANSPYGGVVKSTDSTTKTVTEVTLPNQANALYNAYLDAMKVDNELSALISYNPNDVAQVSLSPDLSKVDNTKLRATGYITYAKAQTYKGLILIHNDNNVTVSGITFINNSSTNDDFSFRAKSSIKSSTREVNPVASGFTSDTLVAWYSNSYLDLSNVKSIYFWSDEDKDDKLDEDEGRFIVNKNSASVDTNSSFVSSENEKFAYQIQTSDNKVSGIKKIER